MTRKKFSGPYQTIEEIESTAKEEAIAFESLPRDRRLTKVGRPRRTAAGTVEIHARVDADVLAWLKKQGRGYQTRMNDILRQAMRQASAS